MTLAEVFAREDAGDADPTNPTRRETMSQASHTTCADILVSLSNHSEDRERRRDLFTTMLRCFAGFGMRVVGTYRSGAILIQRAAWPYGDVFSLCDNGGEVNVGPVNKDDDMRSVPYEGRGGMTGGATLAYRIRCVLDDDEIDYSRDASDMIPILREMAAEQEAARILP